MLWCAIVMSSLERGQERVTYLKGDAPDIICKSKISGMFTVVNGLENRYADSLKTSGHPYSKQPSTVSSPDGLSLAA